MYEDFQQEILALKTKVKGYSNKEPMVFYGSSSFRLWETLGKDIPELEILNLAFGGSNLGACGYYFENIFQGLRPSHIVLYCGDNDIIDGFEENKVVRDFETVLTKVRTTFPSASFTFVSIKPSPIKKHLLQEIQKVNLRISQIVDKIDRSDYLDIYSLMLNKEGKVRTELFTEDELHMNSMGYELWKSIFRSYFELD